MNVQLQAGVRALAPRTDFPLLAGNPEMHYLDSAATTQKPRTVLDALRVYYQQNNANPHRGAYALSAAATDAYRDARDRVAWFLGAEDTDTLIFTRGTTEAINLLATAWGRLNVHSGDRIVVTRMEHHANFVPWQQLALATGAEFRIAELTPTGEVDLDQLRALVTPNTKVLAFAHVSNALGTINPVQEIAAIARRAGALSVCDGAQAAPHLTVGIDRLGVDAFAFSGHKMLGPMGIGGLIARRDVLEAMPPYQMGGDMIAFVGDAATSWNVLPHKFEAGTPNVEGAVGLEAAVSYLQSLGMERVREHEQALVHYAMERLGEVDDLRILGPAAEKRGGVVSFTFAGIHPHDLSQLLDADGVCVRAGHHCAQPLMRSIGVPATTRASFYVYNDSSDVDALVEALERARDRFVVGTR
jgi:cysteine desulfurase/selenocysteine lyase